MSQESSITTPPPPQDQAPPPPPVVVGEEKEKVKEEETSPPVPSPPPVVEEEKEVSPPPPAPPQESKSLAAMMEKEESQSSPPLSSLEEKNDEKTESLVTKEEVVVDEVDVAGKEKQSEEQQQQKVPQTLVSFKEESNIVADLSESEKKALHEFKNLVQEALNTHQFSSSPPPSPPQKEEEKTAQKTPAEATSTTEVSVSKSDVSTEIKTPTDQEYQEPKVEENPSKETQETKQEDPKVESLPEEISIWGIPLLKDDRSDVILLKFLRARDFKVKDAFVMIKNTIRWRKEFKIDELIDEDLGDDLEKIVFMHGHDREGHPVCYNVYGEFQNKELYQKAFADEEKRMKFLRWRIQFLERSIRKLDFSPGGISTIFQVNDLKNSPGPGKKELRLATRKALQLLQDNYPEFVAKQVFINVPWWYLAFYTMISPFMTQRTKSKFVFAGPSKSPETLFKYISAEQVPIQYGGLSVDYCDCNPEFTVADPATEITVKPATKQTVEIIIYEKCVIVWELRVVGWDVSYGAEFAPDAKDAYTVIIQKPTKLSPTDEPVITSSFKVGELGKILLTVDNPTSKKKKLLYSIVGG
ncbi:patellin-3 isoform X2 [Ricinus communis]|uniref:patellin-3 isoform X2 n=1 Tax=Ricinus communis TaxID=3988 RepID=UPI000772B2F1|nr:patellin-3 isoform X2 [Ricinus communis]